MILRMRAVFERIGRRMWPVFSGVIIVEAQKRLYRACRLRRGHRAGCSFLCCRRRPRVPCTRGAPNPPADRHSRQDRCKRLFPPHSARFFVLQGNFTMSSSERPSPKPGVLDIAAYVPGRESAHGVAKVYKLSSNESPLGPSPLVTEAFAARNVDLATYPDGSAHELREAISRGLRAQSRKHPVRQRFGRIARPPVPDLSGSRRRGAVHRTRVSGLQRSRSWPPAPLRFPFRTRI